MTLSHGHLDGRTKTSDRPICIVVDNMVLVSAYIGVLHKIPFYLVPHKHENLFEPLTIQYLFIIFIYIKRPTNRL